MKVKWLSFILYIRLRTREKIPHRFSKSELGLFVWLCGRAESICPCFGGKRERVGPPCTKFRRNSGIHTPAVSPFCLFSFSYSLPALSNLPFQPVQLEITGKHNPGNPKGPVRPNPSSIIPNPRVDFNYLPLMTHFAWELSVQGLGCAQQLCRNRLAFLEEGLGGIRVGEWVAVQVTCLPWEACLGGESLCEYSLERALGTCCGPKRRRPWWEQKPREPGRPYHRRWSSQEVALPGLDWKAEGASPSVESAWKGAKGREWFLFLALECPDQFPSFQSCSSKGQRWGKGLVPLLKLEYEQKLVKHVQGRHDRWDESAHIRRRGWWKRSFWEEVLERDGQ